MVESANLKTMKNINKAQIIQQARMRGPLSRSDLSKHTGLSPATISALVDELLKETLLIEVGEGVSNGGRKPILLDFNPGEHYILSINIALDYVYLALMNLRFEVIAFYEEKIKFPAKENLLKQLKGIIDRSMLENVLKEEQIIGLAIGATGIIDEPNGVITYSAALGLNNYPLAGTLEDIYPFPIFLENDANLAALGEKHFGEAKELSNFFYLNIGSGIGGGIIIDNSIYHGQFGGAGEFGHIILDKNGPLCECGNRGCLNTVLNKYISVETKDKFISDFKKAIEDEDQKSYQQFKEYLAITISNYIKLLDHEAIVFGGEIINLAPPRFYQEIKELIEGYSLKGMNKSLHVFPSTIKGNAILYGGALLCFNKVYNYTSLGK